jgi:hypothetical protein
VLVLREHGKRREDAKIQRLALEQMRRIAALEQHCKLMSKY